MLRKISACVFAMLAFFLMTSTAYAQQTVDRRTLFTFSQPVTLPGITLPAGTYLFRLPSPNGDLSVVQIASPDRERVFATVFTRPAHRNDTPEAPEIRFLEMPSHMPAVVQAFWYPGRQTGWEFVYPVEQAMRIAEARRAATASAPANTDDDRR